MSRRKEKIKSIISNLVWLWIGICVLGLLTGCANIEKNKPLKQSIAVGMPRESDSLDPAGLISQTYLTYALATTDELLTFDDLGNIDYRGAVAYEKNEDATRWVFHLRQEARWSNGESVTAYDYLNTIQRALDPKNNSGYADYLFFIEGAQDIYRGDTSMDHLGIETPDPYTLIFNLEKPCVYFLTLLRLPVYLPTYHVTALNNNVGWDTRVGENVANGPFFLSEYKQNDYIIIEKNPYYWNREQVSLDEIIFRIIPDQQSLAFAYQTGEVDVAPFVPSYVIEQYKDQPDLILSPIVMTRYIYPNLNVSILQDVRIRQALALSIDRAALCKMIGDDTTPTTNFIATQLKEVGSDINFVDTGPIMFEENIDLARKLLAQAGYPEGRGFPELTYNYPSIELDRDVALVLQAQWKTNLGISVQLREQELQVHYSMRRAGDFELSRMQWTADFQDPYTYLSLLISNGTYNSSGIHDASYDSILEASNQTMDAAQRSTLLHRAERIAVAEQFYVIPLFSMVSCNLVNPQIKGITRISASGAMDYRYATIDR